MVALKNRIEKPFYALLNLDRKHEISWLHFEDDKEGNRLSLKIQIYLILFFLDLQLLIININKSY